MTRPRTDSSPARAGARPTLTLSITTRDAQPRLALLLAEAEHYADEIVVGVDEASQDATLEAAIAGADRVFRFSQSTGCAPARMAGLERASCDWILYLDDDEGMDEAFPALRDELLGETSVSSWWLPRKWLTQADPPRHLCAEPWYPDLALRLVRADPTRVWKPLALHSGLRAMGPAGRETRTAILHYERLDRDRAARAEKQAGYVARGQDAGDQRYYAAAPDARTAPVLPAPLRDRSALPRRRPAPHVETAVDDLERRPRVPGWGAVIEAQMPASARPGEMIVATATARNTGTLCWVAPWTTMDWPRLGLAYRLCREGDEEYLPDRAERTHVGRDVAPGATAHFLARCRAPDEPGDYVVAWDLVSEFEHWFSDLGSAPALCPLRVEA